MNYTVKQIAEMMNMTEHTIRFYTDKKLLPCKRDGNNRRVFDEESINWLKGIQCLRGCGVSIEDIKVYSDLCLSDDPTLYRSGMSLFAASVILPISAWRKPRRWWNTWIIRFSTMRTSLRENWRMTPIRQRSRCITAHCKRHDAH